MAHQCKKCNVPAFDTAEKLKNHSRIHSTQCTVKFPGEGLGELLQTSISRDPITQYFVCFRCLSYKTYAAARLQQHCKTCKGGKDSDLLSLPSAIHPSGHPPIPENTRQSYLFELGYFVNEELHIVICRDCLEWIHVGAIWSHASRNHASRFEGHKQVDSVRLAMDIQYFQLDQGKEKLKQYLEAADSLKDPIKGLLVEDGYKCTLCNFCTAKRSTLKMHFYSEHKEGNHSIEHCSERCSVQRLSSCPSLGLQSSSWFGVIAPLSTPTEDGPTSLLSDIISKEAAAREERILAAPYKDPRQLPMFIKLLHWDVFIENMNRSVGEMAPLLTANEPSDVRFFPDHLQKVCGSLMMDFQSTIASVETLLRRKVRSTNPMNVSTSPFSRLEQSCQDYVRELVHLLILLLRALDSKNAEDGTGDILRILVPLEEKMQRLLQRLWNGLQVADGGGQFTDDQLEESKLHCIEVLEALFFVTRSSHAVPEASLLVFRFVIFTSIQQHRVLTPDDVTHRISKMMYWCRSLVLHKIVHYPLNPGDDVVEVEREFLLYIHEDQRTPFGAIVEVKRLVRAITKNETALPKIIWVGDAQIVDGVCVDIAHVSGLVRCSIRELYKELEDDLLLGMPEFNINRDRILYNKSGGLLDDNLCDYRNGQWFVSNKNNLCSGYTLDLILHIARTPSLHSRFINSVQVEGTEEIIWKKDALSKWMGTVGKWLQKLMVIIHLVAGQPARGVELVSCSTRNTPAQIRGVYYVDGLIMLLTLYGKGDNLRGSQVPIARFLCKDTSFLLINYLTYVREMEQVASKVLYGPPETLLYSRLLAVKRGKPMSSQDLSNGMASIFLKHLKVHVSLSPWRHMAIAWMHRFLKYTNVLELTGNGVVDSQAGHSQRVASKCYGRSNFDHPSIGRDEFQLYRWVSVEWHRILGLRTDKVLPNLNAILSVGERPSPTLATYASGQKSDLGFRVAQSESSTSPTADIHHHHHHPKIKVVRCEGDIGIDDLSLTCSKQAVLGLVALGHTKFKSSHQAKAIHRILERQEDLLVVLPTGGGKTLLFLLPAVVEQGRYTTVVICPFVALRNEMEHRAQEAGISMQVFSEPTSLNNVDILLVSVEHCNLPAFQSHLAYLHAQDRLGRIVLDECHVVLADNSWRPILHNVRHVRRAPVPLLLLSATVPPPFESPMKKFFNSQFSIIRSPTTRSNVSYEVRRVHGELGASLLEVLSWGPVTPKSIVFSRGKPETKEMAEMLCAHGLTAVHYHADLDTEARNAAHNAWTRGEADIMVATRAFGTGVDLGAVRLVVHLNEPYSMIHLAQESGRGGRDGSPSKHIVLLAQFRQAQLGTGTAMAEYLGGTKCRRWVLQEYIDGRGLDCFSSGSEICDVCECLVSHVQSGLTTTGNQIESSTSESSKGFNESQYIDLFSSSDDGDIQGTPEYCNPPAKRIRTGDALLSESTQRTRESHADLMLMTLTLVRYLRGLKDKCIVCTMGEHEIPDYKHELYQCPHLKGLCLKCFGNDGHRAKECPNKLQFKGLGCYGCGLPKQLGTQVMHPEPFEGGCRSMGNDKLIPACWYMWRHSARFLEVFIESGCPPGLQDPQFAEWLADAHEMYRTNVLALFISYVRNERLFSE